MNPNNIWLGPEPENFNDDSKSIRERLEELAKASGRTVRTDSPSDDAEKFDSQEELLGALEAESKLLNRAQRRAAAKKG